MLVTKNQVIKGIVGYIRSDLTPQVPDQLTKIVAGAFSHAIEIDSRILDKFIFENRLLSLLITTETEGTYNTDVIFDALIGSMKEYGNLTITIPKIPLCTNDEQMLIFKAKDIEQLRKYVEGSNA